MNLRDSPVFLGQSTIVIGIAINYVYCKEVANPEGVQGARLIPLSVPPPPFSNIL